MKKCLFFLMSLGVFVCAGSWPSVADVSSREVVLVDEGWRFTQKEPQQWSSGLLYDIRPVAKGDDKRERAAEATEDAAKLDPTTATVLKPWILPTGNPFLKDPNKRVQRPTGNPGLDLAYVQAGFDDHDWRSVDLPHDWAIEGPFNSGGVGGSMGRLPSPGVGWYRKKLDIPAADRGKSIFLDIDGAMSYATVWLNGHLVGGWPYGYASWRLNLSPYIVPGSVNQLAIRLDNPPDFSRWYPGAGLYRNVWLVKTNAVHVGHWGSFITTPKVSPAAATVDLRVTIDNDSAAAEAVDVVTEIYLADADGQGKGSPVAAMKSFNVAIAAKTSATVTGSAVVTNPKLWGPPPQQRPNRYIAVTSVLRNNKLLDKYETRFGIRSIAYKPDGLYVNGERIRIQGVNQHHDLGALGTAFNIRAAERQLQILQNMGCNAIRMAHNPPAPELLELADRMGFLVFDEIFDAWVRQKTPFDFHLVFKDWHAQDVRAFLRRDRNHPSVFLWSVGNEVGEQYNGETGAKVFKELVVIAHDEDPTRPVTASMNAAGPDTPFAAAADVISLNYQGEGIRDSAEFADFKGLKSPPRYDAFRARFPDKLILSSESADAYSSRGFYMFPVVGTNSSAVRNGRGGDPATHQVSAYELYSAGFGSSPDKVFAAQDRHPFVGGEFVWSGWDYLGEPSPYYSSRSSYSGIIDLSGTVKDRFYLYQSRWRPDLPVAHILPHWTWPDRIGQITPVHVFTSGDEAELFLNGKSLGRKKKGAFEYRLRWDDVVYQSGTLKVVAYKNGKVWTTEEITSAGDPVRLALTPDRSVIENDGSELSFVTVTVRDATARDNPRAGMRIHFDVKGPGEIVATDNGDPTDLDAFPSHDRKVFNGKCVVIVRSKRGQSGPIVITAKAAGLIEAEAIITAVRASSPTRSQQDFALGH